MSKRWDHHFLQEALLWARMSKDPNTKVGAVLVGPDHELIAAGFNGFPRGVADTDARLADRDMKNRLMVHAERNAILNAARIGVSTKGSTLYLACTDDSGAVWAGPPCTTCSAEIINAGIVEVVGYPMKPVSKWREDLEFAGDLLLEAGVLFREVVSAEVATVPVDIDPCLAKREPGEPMFILLGRDRAAPNTMDTWCAIREREIDLGIRPDLPEEREHIERVRKKADEFRAWRHHPRTKKG